MSEWDRILERLRGQVSTASYENWLAPLLFSRLGTRRLHLTAPNQDVRDWVQVEYVPGILTAAAELGLDISSVVLEAGAQTGLAGVPPPIAQHRHTGRGAAVDPLGKPTHGGDGDIAYLHSFLAQVGLPRSKPKNPDGTPALRYERRSGNCALLVQAGEADDGKRFVQQPIPYGPKPRLMLMDICTRALRERSPDVDLEPSVRQYLTKRLDLQWSGGRKGQYTLFRKQAIALAACSMRLAIQQDRRVIQFQGMPISKFEAWVVDEGGQRPLWPGHLKLSTEFYESLLEHGLPIDMQAYQALSHSALAMDIYTFLAHRLRRIDGSVEISWERLRDAMAPEYSQIRHFREKFLGALKAVQEVYPGSRGRIEPIRGRLRLYRGEAPIESRGARRKQKPGGPTIDA